MKSIRSAVVLVFVLVFAGIAFAGSASEVVKMAKERYAKLNSNVKDAKIVSMSIMEMGGQKMQTNTTLYKKGKKMRMDSLLYMAGTKEPMESITISTQDETWMISPMTGKQKVDKKQLGSNIDMDDAEWWNKLSDDAELKGDEKIDGIVCYVLETKKTASGGLKKMWISKDNIVLVKAAGEDERIGKFEMKSSDFKNVGFNWFLAQRTVVESANGKVISSVSGVEINKGLSDGLFNPSEVDVSKMKMPNMGGMRLGR